MPVEVVQPVVAMPDAQRRVHGRTAYAIADPTPVSRPSEQPTCMCYKPKQPQQPLREPAAAHYPPPPPVPCPVPRRSRTQCPALPPPDAPPSQCCTHHPAPVSPPLCLPTCNAHAQAWPAAAPVLGKRAWRTGRRRFRSMPTCRLPPCSWVPPTATWQGQPGGCRRTRRCCKVRAPPPPPAAPHAYRQLLLCVAWRCRAQQLPGSASSGSRRQLALYGGVARLLLQRCSCDVPATLLQDAVRPPC